MEMALWDIAGKVYNIPVYQMLGGKWRDEIRIYADTTESMDPAEYGRRAKERKAMGLTWMKMDLGINVLDGIPDTVMRPSGVSNWEQHVQPNLFIATEVTDKGIDRLCEYVAAVRENIGYDMPLSMDHLGHIGVKSVIRLGKAYEKFNLEWMEDVIPWYYTDLLKEITQESPTPTLTGEDIYKIEDFETLCREHVVDKIHPDLATSGGILQTHRIGDMAFKLRRAHGHALCRNSGQLHGERPLRRCHAQLSRAREPFARCALLAGPRHWTGKADHQQRLYPRTRYPRPRSCAE